MAKKAKAQAKAKAQQQKQAEVKTSDDTATGHGDQILNADYVAAFEHMMSRIADEEKLENIRDLDSQGIGEGGHAAPIVPEELYQCLKNDNQYEGVGNLFLHDVRWRPLKNLPYNSKGIHDVKVHSFMSPPTGTTRVTIHVVVDSPDDGKEILTTKRGSLHRISPEEPVHALLWGIDAYFSGASDRVSAETTKKWMSGIRNCNYVFHSIRDVDKVIRQSIVLREEWVQRYAACQRSPLTLMMMVMGQKKALEKQHGTCTGQQLFKFYEGIRWASTSEKISKNLIDNVNAISTKWAASTSINCQELVKKSEEIYGVDGPFCSVLSIYLIADKAGKLGENIGWTFDMVFDQFRAKTGRVENPAAPRPHPHSGFPRRSGAPVHTIATLYHATHHTSPSAITIASPLLHDATAMRK